MRHSDFVMQELRNQKDELNSEEGTLEQIADKIFDKGVRENVIANADGTALTPEQIEKFRKKFQKFFVEYYETQYRPSILQDEAKPKVKLDLKEDHAIYKNKEHLEDTQDLQKKRSFVNLSSVDFLDTRMNRSIAKLQSIERLLDIINEKKLEENEERFFQKKRLILLKEIESEEIKRSELKSEISKADAKQRSTNKIFFKTLQSQSAKITRA